VASCPVLQLKAVGYTALVHEAITCPGTTHISLRQADYAGYIIWQSVSGQSKHMASRNRHARHAGWACPCPAEEDCWKSSPICSVHNPDSTVYGSAEVASPFTFIIPPPRVADCADAPISGIKCALSDTRILCAFDGTRIALKKPTRKTLSAATQT